MVIGQGIVGATNQMIGQWIIGGGGGGIGGCKLIAVGRHLATTLYGIVARLRLV